ncbi:MAG: GMC oxidoreductase [Acidimicrobiales bacterium]
MKTAAIVGSGAAGATIARLLARSGEYHVVVLEKGQNLFSGLGGDVGEVRSAFPNDELGYVVRGGPIGQDTLLEPRSFRTSPRDGIRSHVGAVNNLPTTVGGATVHFPAKTRRFREVDFVANQLMGGSDAHPAVAGTTYRDWPIHYNHLEPFYAVMEEVVGVQGPARRARSGTIINPNPCESYRSTPYAMPPGTPMYSNLLLADAASRLGHHPAPVPTAVNSRPYRDRPACDDCSFCALFGCGINAKGGGIWQLADALATGHAELLAEANVTEVLWTRRGSSFHADGVRYIDGAGRSRVVRSDLVILANTPIEATRLSLLSGIGVVHPDEARLSAPQPTTTEPSGLLGRNIMFNLQTLVLGVVDKDIHPWRGRAATHTIDDFAGTGPTVRQFRAEVPRGGILELGGSVNPIDEAMYMATIAYGQEAKDLLAVSPLRRHLLALLMQGEDMPQITNYVDIDPDLVDVCGTPAPRVTYASHSYELAAAAYYAPKMLEIMHAVGGHGSAYPDVRVVAATLADTTYPAAVPSRLVAAGDPIARHVPTQEVPSSAHIMGTHRMATTSEGGPCTPYGRYWAFDNLFHAGAGLFVTAPGYNPTLTTWALSYWVGAAILTDVASRARFTATTIDDDAQTLQSVIARLDPNTMAARELRP